MKVVVEIIELRFDLPAKPKPPAEREVERLKRAAYDSALDNDRLRNLHDASTKALMRVQAERDQLKEDRDWLVAAATKWQDRAEVAEAELAEIKQSVTESSPAKVAELRRELVAGQARLGVSYRERDLLLEQRDEFAARNVELQKQLNLAKIAESLHAHEG